jgi:hypothetical protein
MTLAGQAFPPDTLSNPFLSYALINWQNGNIARNFATTFGLPGFFSLLPLIVLLSVLAILWFRMAASGQTSLESLSLGGQIKERQPTHGA